MIDEEENIDRLLKDTGNSWSADVFKNEANFDGREVMGLEEEKLELQQ